MADGILHRIVETKRNEIPGILRREGVLEELIETAPTPKDLLSAFRREGEVAVMAEVKRRSPGAGPIKPDLCPDDLAAAYQKAGVAAVSVLTDEEYFGGHIRDMESVRNTVSIPVFRKEFIIHRVQLLQARAHGADGTLLIARILSDEELVKLHAQALELGLTPMVEVHDREELARALGAGASLVGINNRNLQTFSTSLEVTLDLLPRIPGEVTVVSESGIKTRDEVDQLGAAGVHGILVGETFLRASDPGRAARELVGRRRIPRTAEARPVEVKICGLTRREDAEYAVRQGASFLGAVLVPGTPRAITPEEAGEVFDGLDARGVVVVANLSAAECAGAAHLAGANVIQLHGEEDPDLARALGEMGPWEVWKALRVQGLEDAREGLNAFSQVVDGILLDGWHPEQRGGSGTPFSWKEVAGLRRDFRPGLRLIAAGGLAPDNIQEAIRMLDPDVVDVSSGVEDGPGIKNRKGVLRFIRNAQQAVRTTSSTHFPTVDEEGRK